MKPSLSAVSQPYRKQGEGVRAGGTSESCGVVP